MFGESSLHVGVAPWCGRIVWVGSVGVGDVVENHLSRDVLVETFDSCVDECTAE